MKFFSSNLDFFGFSTSLLCAIHCVLIPIAFAFGLFKGAHWLANPFVEWGFIFSAILIASLSLIQSYLNKHKKGEPLLIASIGFLMLIISHEFVVIWWHYIAALGGLFIAVAHYLNWKLLYTSKKSQEIPSWSFAKEKTL